MQSPEYHVNSIRAGKTFWWSGMDNVERFRQHMNNPETAERLTSLGWDQPNCIEYTYNSHGFRTSEFTDQLVGIALGCSFTEGVGVKAHQTWPFVLSEKMNFPIHNMGVGGSSLDTAFRLLDFYIDKLNIKFIALCSPARERFEIFEYGQPISLLPKDATDLRFTPYFKHRIVDGKEDKINHKKNLLAIQQLCDKHDILLAHIHITNFECDACARDLAHPSPTNHKAFAEKMSNEIQRIMQ
jgi:hypothetical protein